ncbi:hypothetical protein E2C01_036328 [Portunus trituberculatus]|uniref:Uncharacterized protein n=1 Tax=Portunus trituberculatus TaxID=210409 RepID=A0A5B7F6G1_PORTR|nr:hypothetical protein [Portunus trituberculatus]
MGSLWLRDSLAGLWVDRRGNNEQETFVDLASPRLLALFVSRISFPRPSSVLQPKKYIYGSNKRDIATKFAVTNIVFTIAIV